MAALCAEPRLQGEIGETFAPDDLSVHAGPAPEIDRSPARPEIAALRVRGGLPVDTVRRIVSMSLRELAPCWPTDGGPGGAVHLHAEVDPDAVVAVTVARSDLPAAPTDCVVAGARAWRFPRPIDAVPARFELELRYAPAAREPVDR